MNNFIVFTGLWTPLAQIWPKKGFLCYCKSLCSAHSTLRLNEITYSLWGTGEECCKYRLVLLQILRRAQIPGKRPSKSWSSSWRKDRRVSPCLAWREYVQTPSVLSAQAFWDVQHEGIMIKAKILASLLGFITNGYKQWGRYILYMLLRKYSYFFSCFVMLLPYRFDQGHQDKLELHYESKKANSACSCSFIKISSVREVIKRCSDYTLNALNYFFSTSFYTPYTVLTK